MIIRCDQCKTRFRLDDSKVTASGVRVRCSKCKHTFVVSKEVHEDESDHEEMSCKPESSADEALQQDDDTTGDAIEHTAAEQKSCEINHPCETVPASGKGLSDECIPDNENSVEDDFHLFKAKRSDSGTVPSAAGPEDEKVPFQWPVEKEADAHQNRKDDDFEIAVNEDKEGKEVISWGIGDVPSNYKENKSLVEDYRPTDTVEGVTTENPSHSRLSETDGTQFREDFPADSGPEKKEHDSDETDDFSLGYARGSKTVDQILTEKNQPFVVSNVADAGVIGGSSDLPDIPVVQEEKREPSSFTSNAEKGFPSSHSRDGAEEILPPLSITSRRRGTLSLTKVLVGILVIMLFVVIAGLYFFRADLAALNFPGFSSFSKRLITGRWKSEEIAIKNLEGAFVRNNHGGDIFVIRGEAFNQSGKPSSSIRVQGHIYGAKGEVLLSGFAYFGKVLSNERLSVLSVNEVKSLSGNKAGNAPRNLIMQPGKKIPFQIVFMDVPVGAGEFGAEVVSSTTGGQ